MNGLGISRYIDELSAGRLPLVSAKMGTTEELKRRYFVLGFKTLRVELQPYHNQFSSNPLADFEREFAALRAWGFIEEDGHSISLTKLGRVNCDMVSSVFFSAEEANVPHPEEPEIRRMEVYG